LILCILKVPNGFKVDKKPAIFGSLRITIYLFLITHQVLTYLCALCDNNLRGTTVEQENVSTCSQVLSDGDFAICKWLVRRSIENSINGLAKMLGEELTINDIDISQVPLKETINFLGGPDNPVIGIHLDIYGDTEGHLLLVHDHQLAFQLVGYQMGSHPINISEFGEIELSLLSEMGNIVGAFFLNVLADATDLELSPSPPILIIDKAINVIRDAADKLINGQHTQFIVKASFVTRNQLINGTFLLIPTMDLMNRIIIRARNT
jgi:chemotaxis protein CheC